MIMTTDDTKIAGLRSKERWRDHDPQPSLKPMTKTKHIIHIVDGGSIERLPSDLLCHLLE